MTRPQRRVRAGRAKVFPELGLVMGWPGETARLSSFRQRNEAERKRQPSERFGGGFGVERRWSVGKADEWGGLGAGQVP